MYVCKLAAPTTHFQYKNEIKYVLRITKLSFYFIILNVGYKFLPE